VLAVSINQDYPKFRKDRNISIFRANNLKKTAWLLDPEYIGGRIVRGTASGAAAPSGRIQGPTKRKIVIAKPDFVRLTNFKLVRPIKKIQ
jgi:hypothetical protein